MNADSLSAIKARIARQKQQETANKTTSDEAMPFAHHEPWEKLSRHLGRLCPSPTTEEIGEVAEAFREASRSLDRFGKLDGWQLVSAINSQIEKDESATWTPVERCYNAIVTCVNATRHSDRQLEEYISAFADGGWFSSQIVALDCILSNLNLIYKSNPMSQREFCEEWLGVSQRTLEKRKLRLADNSIGKNEAGELLIPAATLFLMACDEFPEKISRLLPR